MKKKEKNKFTLFKNIFLIYKDLFKIDKFVVIIILLQSILYAISPFIMVLLPKYLLDELQVSNVNVFLVAALVIGSAILNLICNGLANYLDLESYPRIEKFINIKRVQTRRKICELDQQDLENPTILDMHSKANQAINNYGMMNLIYNSISELTNLITLLGCISIIFTLNGLIVIALIIPILLGFFNEYLWSKNHKKQQDVLHPIWRRLLYLTDIIIRFQYGKDIRLFGMRKWLIEKYDNSSMEEYRNLKKLWKNNLRSQLGGSFAQLITSLIVYGYLTYSVISKGISIGDYLMYTSAIFTFVNRSTWFLQSINYTLNTNRYVDDYFTFMNYKKEKIETTFNDINEIKKFNIEFKNVSFKYPNQENFALENINLKITNNEKLAIVGFNGAGKSTFIKLLTRLYEPTSGEILINGKKPGIESKEIISYLPEKTYLDREMKVKDAIKYFKEFYKNFDSEKALKLLNDLDLDVNTKISKMSKGMQEKLQLILVMSRKAELYILDEPLGGVDPATRDYILDTILSNFGEGASVIISTHLIADIERILDEVIFIDKGQIIVTSSADELRNKEKLSIDEIFRRYFKC